MTGTERTLDRQVVFISKATPEDDEFVLWLGPRLEAAGYRVFADILTLEPGDRWRKVVTSKLQNEAVKMILCCRDASLAKNGVQEEIGIAEDLVKELNDPRFIIPLRLERFKRLFGIGELQFVDFLGGWAPGLTALLDALERQGVPRRSGTVAINPNWEAYRKRLSIDVQNEPETLTSNWLPIIELPNEVRYYAPTGSLKHEALAKACRAFAYPAEVWLRGFFSFAGKDDIDANFGAAGHFKEVARFDVETLLAKGSDSPATNPRQAKNVMSSLFRQAWEQYCRERSLVEYAYSKQLGFHIGESQVPLGKRIPWGDVGQRRSSMLRNIAGNRVWQYGVSIHAQFWPLPHFKLKARVLFAELAGKKAGAIFDDVRRQHRSRRTICKGWRNKQWHGRLMAYLRLIANGADELKLPLAPKTYLQVCAKPLTMTSPVSTPVVDAMPEDGEEADLSTLGQVYVEEEAR